jgi:SAM-dependent methyltransferase
MSFPLFQTPIQLAHHIWDLLLKKEDTVIDATCGNGKDSLILASILSKKGGRKLICIDIQEQALLNTKTLLEQKTPLFFSKVDFILGSHITLPDTSPKLIVYNLGYLPKGDKTLTTQADSTLVSVQNALKILTPGGALSITCYPGHLEGLKEQTLLNNFLTNLSPTSFSVTCCKWSNRNASPSLIIVQKSINNTKID